MSVCHVSRTRETVGFRPKQHMPDVKNGIDELGSNKPLV